MRLKTKLVIAITLMVGAIVLTLSTIYIAQLVHQVVNDAVNDADMSANEILHLSRLALETDINSTRVDPTNAEQVNQWVEESLQSDPGVNGEIESLIGFNPIISDASVVGPDGRAILHSNPEMVCKLVPTRPDFHKLANARFWRQLQLIYERPLQPYVVEIALKIQLDRDYRPFGSVQVAVLNEFLRSALQPHLRRALGFSAIAILVSLVLAAALSSRALRPLEAISRRLDQMTAGEMTAPIPQELI